MSNIQKDLNESQLTKKYGKGMKFLQKMGFEVGKGLGENKEGITAPLAVKKVDAGAGMDIKNITVLNEQKTTDVSTSGGAAARNAAYGGNRIEKSASKHKKERDFDADRDYYGYKPEKIDHKARKEAEEAARKAKYGALGVRVIDMTTGMAKEVREVSGAARAMREDIDRLRQPGKSREVRRASRGRRVHTGDLGRGGSDASGSSYDRSLSVGSSMPSFSNSSDESYYRWRRANRSRSPSPVRDMDGDSDVHLLEKRDAYRSVLDFEMDTPAEQPLDLESPVVSDQEEVLRETEQRSLEAMEQLHGDMTALHERLQRIVSRLSSNSRSSLGGRRLGSIGVHKDDLQDVSNEGEESTALEAMRRLANELCGFRGREGFFDLEVGLMGVMLWGSLLPLWTQTWKPLEAPKEGTVEILAVSRLLSSQCDHVGVSVAKRSLGDKFMMHHAANHLETGETAANRALKTLNLFEKLQEEHIVPLLARTFARELDANDSVSSARVLALADAWIPILPSHLSRGLLESSIMPKLEAAVAEWTPTVPFSLRQLYGPWSALLKQFRLETLLLDIVGRRIGEIMRELHWQVDDESVRLFVFDLVPQDILRRASLLSTGSGALWRSLERSLDMDSGTLLNEGQFDTLLSRYIMPVIMQGVASLSMSPKTASDASRRATIEGVVSWLSADLEVRQPPPLSLEHGGEVVGVVENASVLPSDLSERLAKALAGVLGERGSEVVSQWVLEVQTDFLSRSDGSGATAARKTAGQDMLRWYKSWREVIPAPLLKRYSCLKAALLRVLDTLHREALGGDPSLTPWRTAPAAQGEEVFGAAFGQQAYADKATAPLQTAFDFTASFVPTTGAAVTSADMGVASHEVGMLEVLERMAGDRGFGIVRANANSNKDTYRLVNETSSQRVTFYVEKDVVYVKEEENEWTPITITNLFSRVSN